MSTPRTLSVLAATSIAAVLLSSSTPAHATSYPEKAYPGPARPYVAHPEGFADSTYVVRRANGTLGCTEPLTTAVHQDARATMRKEIAPLVQELMRQTEVKYGYNIRGRDTGGFNCRFMAGSKTSISNHAYGRAIDINWSTNPYQKTFTSDIPPNVVSLWIRHGFYWGGHYKNTHDTMHFEYVAPLKSAPAFLNSARRESGGTSPTPTPPPASCPSSTLASYPTIRSGSSGSAVTIAQCRLRTAGSSITADGAFGPTTSSAVKSFQSARGLAADGIVGSRTWTALLAYGSQPTLKAGSSGAHVTRLQQALRARGQRIAVDGAFGAGTTSVVKAYQKAAGLTSDGIVGPRTWSTLQRGR